MAPYKTPADAVYPLARFRTDRVDAQDYMVWETQGPISNRPAERLASSDSGVVMFREMLERELVKVETGLDPIFFFRDPDHEMIDSRLDVTLEHMRARGDGRFEARVVRR